MKLYNITCLNSDYSIQKEVYDLSSFGYFESKTIKELVQFLITTVAKRCQPKVYTIVEYQNFVCHCKDYKVVITDNEYPNQSVYQLLFEMEKCELCELDYLIKKYQQPQPQSQLQKLQLEIDETKHILHKTIETILERGEKIEDLVERSELLTLQSKTFFKQAKRHSSCCTFM